MPPLIQIRNIGKQYRMAAAQPYLSLRDAVRQKSQRLFRRKKERHFWALSDISLDIRQGERIGIIGRNGAGKSTLLKVLSRITPPTTGSISIEGRVASLLEVGTGFHPELTGRENVFFNGSVLGLKRSEIKARFDEIVAFSGVGKFIDMPLKQYSSGMQLRLAFSVAAHLEPEVLLIDEVLAVGDMEFQKRCLGKMEDVSKQEGRTILFVSHNLAYLTSLCNRGVLLEEGKLVRESSMTEVINTYRTGLSKAASSRVWADGEQPGNTVVRLLSVRIVDGSGTARESIGVAEPVGIRMAYEVLQNGHVLWLGHNIHNEAGINIFDTHSVGTEQYQKPHEKGSYTATAWIPPHLLNPGSFVVSTAAFNHLKDVIHFHERDILLFTVHEVFDAATARGMSPDVFPGVVRPLLTWNIQKQ